MAIERLSFDKKNQYNAVELAIHLARYSIVQKLCRNLDILDVACGEGYGSYAMASFWEAKSVTGIDISKQAISNAQNVFASEKVKYIASSAEDIVELFEENSFDLIISLETIEHVKNPEHFLSAIKRLLKPNGIAVISCPNDHWYYGAGESKNPYHLHTYYFDEFKKQAELFLGEATCYLFGRPINGFGNFFFTENHSKGIAEELKLTTEISTFQINTDQTISTEDCSYFIGVWGHLPIENKKLENATIFPISMNKFSLPLEDENYSLKTEIDTLKINLDDAENKSTNLAKRLSEVEKWTVELQNALQNVENYAVELKVAFRASEVYNIELSNSIKKLTYDLEKSKKQTELVKLELNQKKVDIEEKKRNLKSLEETIAKMKESKFWKLRNNWVKLKDIISINSKRKEK